MKSLLSILAATILFAPSAFGVTLTSAYQPEKSEQFFITLDGFSEARFYIDPNHCGLDKFGATTFCTEIAGISKKSDLTVVSTEGKKTLLSFDEPSLSEYRLVMENSIGGLSAQLMVLDAAGKIIKIMPLTVSL